MRSRTSFSKSGFDLNGTISLSPVSGRAVEICGTFEVGTSDFGFNIFKGKNGAAVISYKPSTGTLTADFSALPRLQNDNGVYDGIYHCPLPETPARGTTMKLNIFIDHSIIDIFINDKWATSIRVFPTDSDADAIEAFSSAPTRVRDLKAWELDVNASSSDIKPVWADKTADNDRLVDVFNMQGMKIKSNVHMNAAADNLPNGLYIIGNKKVFIK